MMLIMLFGVYTTVVIVVETKHIVFRNLFMDLSKMSLLLVEKGILIY